jgi:hypothetical protein
MVDMIYYDIQDITDNFFEPINGKNTVIIGMCRYCKSIPLMSPPISMLPVRIIENRPLLTSYSSWGYGVIHARAVEAIQDIDKWLFLEKMSDEYGNVINDYYFYTGKNRLLFRGDSSSHHRVCKKCGKLIYVYLPRSSPYIVQSSIDCNIPIYAVDNAFILAREDFKEKLQSIFPGSAAFYSVPIQSNSDDGLPNELPLWPDSDFKVTYKKHWPF